MIFFGFAVFKIRLSESYNNPPKGVVEVFVDGYWGVICDRNVLGIDFADVVCRELGYTTTEKNLTEEYPHRNRYYKFGSDRNDRVSDSSRARSHGYYRWFYRDLRCKGTEDTLENCYYSNQIDSCVSQTIAAVKCNVTPYKIDGKI